MKKPFNVFKQQTQPAKPIEHRGTFRFTILHDVPMRDFDDAPWTLLAGTICMGNYYEEQIDGSLYIRPREHIDMTLDPGDVRIELLSGNGDEP